MRSTRTTTLTTLASSCSPYRLPLALHQRSAAQYFTGLHPHINTSYTTLTSNMRAIIVSKQGDPSVLELKHDLPHPPPHPRPRPGTTPPTTSALVVSADVC
jgi:hypothetical protein